MDSRDVKENPTLQTGFLEDIYRMQRGLLDHYISIEGLPPYPVDTNVKTSQTLLKDFTSRVVEELAEGYEALQSVAAITQDNLMWVGDFDDEAYNAMLNHLQNVGEEQADSLHFMIELMIYSNIQPEDIKAYINKHFRKNLPESKNDEDPNDILTMAVYAGLLACYNWADLDDFDNFGPGVFRPLINGSVNTTFGNNPDDLKYLYCGNNCLAITNQRIISNLLWGVTYHLNIARNFLKNKPWKQSEVMTQESKFQEQLVLAFITYMGVLKVMGCTPELIYFLYFKKNHVNQFRIKSNY